jgi:phosphate transport system substrate-binding protein
MVVGERRGGFLHPDKQVVSAARLLMKSTMWRYTTIWFLLFTVTFLSTACGPTTSQESRTSATRPIENKGSDTIVNLTGIAALINGTVDIANASRQIKTEEQAEAEANGVTPTEFVIARDAIAIIVNHENPVDNLTLQLISDIYSGKINNWSEVGGEDRPIVRLSRETNSGTHVYFLENVLRLGNKESETLFSVETLLLPSSEGITSEVRENPNAIGYDGLGYVTDEVKVIGVGLSLDGPFVYPSPETVNTNMYPIARDLYMYTVGEPTGEIKAYLDWILSPQAQEIVSELGFVPVNP